MFAHGFRMKTIIDIPDLLYRKAKIRAVETGRTLKQVVLTSLERELDLRPAQQAPLTWANRTLRPEFARLDAEGAFIPKTTDRDITDLISDDRNER
jgi:hypothetical protein